MGLQSLLPLLSPVKVRVNLGQLSQGKPGGIIIAQDAYVWLHEFTAKQARRVVIEKDRMVVAQEMLLRCRRFMACGVTVVLVFDGKRQKAKASTDEQRTRKRLKALAEVERLLGIDDDAEDIDSTLLKVAAHVDDEMKLMTIKHLRENGWPHYMVAPFEADGQMAKLLKDGDVHYVSTVDSDLLALSKGNVLLRLSPAGWADLYGPRMEELAAHDLGLSGSGGDSETDSDSDSDDEADGAAMIKTSNTLRLSKMMMSLICKHGANNSIKFYGMLVKNDYNQFKGCGVSTALMILKNVEGSLCVDALVKSITDLTTAAGKRRRDPGGRSSQHQRGISTKIEWGGEVHLRASLEKCLTMFERQLVYDASMRDFVTLSGEPDGNDANINRASFDSLPRPRLRRLTAKARSSSSSRSRGAAAAADGDDDNDDDGGGGQELQQLKGPAGWAVGMYDNENQFIGDSMPKISKLPVIGHHVPIKLEPSMVVGAVLPKEEVKDNRVGELARYLRCLGISIPGDKKDKGGLIELVTTQVALEKANPGMVTIYDPDCHSLSKRLLEGKIVPAWHTNLGGGTIPDKGDAGWVDLDGMAEVAPIMSESVVREFFKEAGANLDPNARVLEEGLGLIQSASFLPNFRYHPGLDGKGTEVFFTLDVPATTRTGVSYPNYIQCACLPAQGDALGRVISITCAVCGDGSAEGPDDAGEDDGSDADDAAPQNKKSKKRDASGARGCKAKEWKCIHKSALIQAVQNIARPNAATNDKRDIPTTSCICRWNNPGSGDMASPEQLLECLCVRKPKRLLKLVGKRVCLSEGLSRANFSAMDLDDFENTKAAVKDPESEPKFLRQLQEMFDAAAADYGGRRCCAEIQWHGGDAGRSELP